MPGENTYRDTDVTSLNDLHVTATVEPYLIILLLLDRIQHPKFEKYFNL